MSLLHRTPGAIAAAIAASLLLALPQAAASADGPPTGPPDTPSQGAGGGPSDDKVCDVDLGYEKPSELDAPSGDTEDRFDFGRLVWTADGGLYHDLEDGWALDLCVKGGPDAHEYTAVEGSNLDDAVGLLPPTMPNGNVPGISHVGYRIERSPEATEEPETPTDPGEEVGSPGGVVDLQLTFLRRCPDESSELDRSHWRVQPRAEHTFGDPLEITWRASDGSTDTITVDDAPVTFTTAWDVTHVTIHLDDQQLDVEARGTARDDCDVPGGEEEDERPTEPAFTFDPTETLPVCRADAAYLTTALTQDGYDATEATLHWVALDPEGAAVTSPLDDEPVLLADGTTLRGEIRHHDTIAIGTDELRWPGMEVDDDGAPTDWPGWILEEGTWSEGDDGFAWARGDVAVFATFNPTTAAVPVAYPPASEACAAAPPAEADDLDDERNDDEVRDDEVRDDERNDDERNDEERNDEERSDEDASRGRDEVATGTPATGPDAPGSDDVAVLAEVRTRVSAPDDEVEVLAAVESRDELPRTGASTLMLALSGLLALGFGGGALARTRRRTD